MARRSWNDFGWPSGVRPSGILTDEDIAAYARRNHLIVPFNPEDAKYASYEVHASENAQILIYHGEVTAHAPLEPVNGELVIESGATVRIDTVESIRLPDDMMANIIGLGQLYACGVTVANTYIDPGSRGPVYLALTNLGQRSVRIPVGEPIGRVQFHQLGRSVLTAHPGPVYRRSIQLRVGTEQANGETRPGRVDGQVPTVIDPTAAVQLAARQDMLDRRLALLKLCLYGIGGAWLGLLWAIAPHHGNALLRFLNGDGIPDWAKFVVALVVPVLLSMLFKDMRTSVAWALRRRSTNPSET